MQMVETPVGAVPRVATRLSLGDRLGTIRVRLNLFRMDYRVESGLHAVGAPNPDSPVLVSANFKLSFDALRRELAGIDAWILVLDTRGVNVWCAAGKGTFGTVELAKRVLESRLAEVVEHRTLVVPQLGAPGVSAHEVKTFTGFRVVYGPVRAADIREFLVAGMKATPEMRRVRFTLRDRVVLTGVETSIAFQPKVLAAAVGFLALTGLGLDPLFSLDRVLGRGVPVLAAALLAVLAGLVLTPVLLPWVPGRMFSQKGAIVGALTALAAIAAVSLAGVHVSWLAAVAGVAGITAGASFGAMNFTGSSTYTSFSGVNAEMRRWLPVQVGLAATSVVALLASAAVAVIA